MKAPTNVAELRRFVYPNMTLRRESTHLPDEGEVVVERCGKAVLHLIYPATKTSYRHHYGAESEYVFDESGFTHHPTAARKGWRQYPPVRYLYPVGAVEKRALRAECSV